MTLAYFCLASLALLPSSAVSTTDPTLSALDVMLKPAQKQGFRDWVYEQQMSGGGFRGSDSLAAASSPERGAGRDQEQGNVIQTYTAMLVLGLLGDDFERLDRAALKRFLRECQNQDGSCVPSLSPRGSLAFSPDCSAYSFSLFPGCEEAADPRSSYSAFAVASMLDEWECIDVERGLAFLECCRVRVLPCSQSSDASCAHGAPLERQSYEGAYAQRPGLEANGVTRFSLLLPVPVTAKLMTRFLRTAGPTYCAIAAYSLASRLHTISQPDRLLRWLVDRQVEPPLPSHSETDSDSDGLSESRLSESVHDGIAAPPLKESLPSPAPQHRSDPPGSQPPLPNLAISSAGFQGRANKPTDACYSFWNVAALSVGPRVAAESRTS